MQGRECKVTGLFNTKLWTANTSVYISRTQGPTINLNFVHSRHIIKILNLLHPLDYLVSHPNTWLSMQALVARLLEGSSVGANNAIISGVLVTVGDLARVVCMVSFFLVKMKCFLDINFRVVLLLVLCTTWFVNFDCGRYYYRVLHDVFY